MGRLLVRSVVRLLVRSVVKLGAQLVALGCSLISLNCDWHVPQQRFNYCEFAKRQGVEQQLVIG